MSPLVWVLVSSVAWVGADVLRKTLAGPVGAAPLGAILALGSLVVFLPMWLVSGGTISAGYIAPALLSLVANVGASLLMIVALHRGELGVVVPLLALTPALSALGDWAMGGAPPGPRQSAGIGLVVMGALALQLKGLRPRLDQTALMAIAVAVLFSATAVLDARALQASSAALHGLLQSAGVGLAMVGIACCMGQGRRLLPPPESSWLLLAAVAVYAGGYITQLLALEHVPASVHETAKRAVGMLGALLVGSIGFQERVTLPRGMGVLSMLIGVAMVLL